MFDDELNNSFNRNNIKSRNYAGKNANSKQQNNIWLVLFVSIIVSFACGVIGAYLICQTVSVEQVVKNITTSELVENSISSSVDKVYNSTVIVQSYSKGNLISTGTGFVYKKDSKTAYILTNNHVIADADEVKVEFNNSDESIKVLTFSGDQYADIAVLTISASEDIPVVETGDNDSLKLGDTIFTVGNPMGITYKGTVTKGILSGKDRMVEVSVSGGITDYYMKVMQIDAAVNPGNSGGPLCDVSGKVIGIISLKIVQDEIEGMGFAIPIEDALKYASMIEENGSIVRPFVGISMLDLNNDYNLWKSGIAKPEDVDEGVAVVSVEKGSPAAKGGLQKGDIIVALDEEKTPTVKDFRYVLYKYEVGDKIEVTYYRDGKIKKTTITLGKSNN